MAAAWQTHAHWGDAAGNVPPRFLWTALDCPGQFAFYAGGMLFFLFLTTVSLSSRRIA